MEGRKIVFMQFLAFEQLNHNPESLRDALFAVNIEYNAPGAKLRIEKSGQRSHHGPVAANITDQELNADVAIMNFGMIQNRHTTEPLAKLSSGYKLCQGTTSVVPQMVNSDSGFSRCGIANN
jgi:hypothetical protein